MRKLVRLTLLTLAFAVSVLTLSPRDGFAACTNGDTQIRQGRCCLSESGPSRLYLEYQCDNGVWRFVEAICSSQPC